MLSRAQCQEASKGAKASDVSALLPEDRLPMSPQRHLAIENDNVSAVADSGTDTPRADEWTPSTVTASKADEDIQDALTNLTNDCAIDYAASRAEIATGVEELAQQSPQAHHEAFGPRVAQETSITLLENPSPTIHNTQRHDLQYTSSSQRPHRVNARAALPQDNNVLPSNVENSNSESQKPYSGGSFEHEREVSTMRSDISDSDSDYTDSDGGVAVNENDRGWGAPYPGVSSVHAQSTESRLGDDLEAGNTAPEGLIVHGEESSFSGK